MVLSILITRNMHRKHMMSGTLLAILVGQLNGGGPSINEDAVS